MTRPTAEVMKGPNVFSKKPASLFGLRQQAQLQSLQQQPLGLSQSPVSSGALKQQQQSSRLQKFRSHSIVFY